MKDYTSTRKNPDKYIQRLKNEIEWRAGIDTSEREYFQAEIKRLRGEQLISWSKESTKDFNLKDGTFCNMGLKVGQRIAYIGTVIEIHDTERNGVERGKMVVDLIETRALGE